MQSKNSGVLATGKTLLQQHSMCTGPLLAGRTSQLAHDLGAVDEEEERPRLIRHRACDQGLACAAFASCEQEL